MFICWSTQNISVLAVLWFLFFEIQVLPFKKQVCKLISSLDCIVSSVHNNWHCEFFKENKKKFFSFYVSQHSTTSDVKPRAFRISVCFLISVEYFLLNSRVQKQQNLNPRHPAVWLFPSHLLPTWSGPVLSFSLSSSMGITWPMISMCAVKVEAGIAACISNFWWQSAPSPLPFPLTEGNPGDAKIVGNYCYCLFLQQTNSILGLFQGVCLTVKLQLGSVSVVTGTWGFLSLLQIGAFVLQCREMQAWDNPRDLEKWRWGMWHGGVQEWNHKRCGS